MRGNVLYFSCILLTMNDLIRSDEAFSSSESAFVDNMNKKRRIKTLGPLEGREQSTLVIGPKYGAKEGEDPSAFLGRNRKKLKHRRINAFEVNQRRLEEREYLGADGKLDMDGLKILIENEDQRAGGEDCAAPLKHYTLEDLDRMYPTPEGNVRLGLAKPESLATFRNFSALHRWERQHHFVSMRKPNQMAQVLPNEITDYSKGGGKMTIIVHGSIGYSYAIDVQEYDTIGQVKELIWKQEEIHRWDIENLKLQDEQQNFDIRSQELIMNGNLLYPDGRTLKWFNVTEDTIVRVIPKVEEFEIDDEGKAFSLDLLWWRERIRYLTDYLQ